MYLCTGNRSISYANTKDKRNFQSDHKKFKVFWISCDPQNFYLLQIWFLVTLHVKFSLHSGIASNPLSDYVTVTGPVEALYNWSGQT